MNKNTIYVVIGAIVLVGIAYFLLKDSSMMAETPENVVATTTEQMATSTSTTTTETTGTVSTNGQVTATGPKGYPASWPSDVPKYPNGLVNTTAGNNPKSLPSEAGVVFTTNDSVKTVVSFYLNGLRANGWTIVEDGAGTGNMTGIKATKGKRAFGGFIQKESSGKTEATLGVNLGI